MTTLALLGIGDWFRDLFANLVCWIKSAGIEVLNALVSGVGAIWSAAVGLLPGMPGQPAMPGVVRSGFEFARWMVPWDFVVSVVEADMAIIAAMFVAMALLRWVRVVE